MMEHAKRLPPLVEADQTARLLNRLARVRQTYKPGSGFLDEMQQERLPEAARVRYYRLPATDQRRK